MIKSPTHSFKNALHSASVDALFSVACCRISPIPNAMHREDANAMQIPITLVRAVFDMIRSIISFMALRFTPLASASHCRIWSLFTASASESASERPPDTDDGTPYWSHAFWNAAIHWEAQRLLSLAIFLINCAPSFWLAREAPWLAISAWIASRISSSVSLMS